jgi:hypothetical protein
MLLPSLTCAILALMTGEDVPIHLGHVPPAQMKQENTGEPLGEHPSHSDDPYQRDHSRHSQPLRKGTAIPPSGTSIAPKGYPSTTEADGPHPHPGSMSSLHLSLHAIDSSVNNRTFLKHSLQGSRSRLSAHELPRSHSPQQGHMDDTHSVTTTHTQFTRHLAPSIAFSRHTFDSRLTVGTGGSLTRSIAGSESRQAAYRTHKGPVHSRPVSVRSSLADRSPVVSAPLDLPVHAVTAPDTAIDGHVHYTAPPGSDDGPGPEVVMLYDGPPIAGMVAEGVRRYQRCNPR